MEREDTVEGRAFEMRSKDLVEKGVFLTGKIRHPPNHKGNDEVYLENGSQPVAAVWVSREIKLERSKVRCGRPKELGPRTLREAGTQIRGKP